MGATSDLSGGKQSLALSVAPSLFADALASVLAADGVDEVIDLTQLDAAAAAGQHYHTAVVSPGLDHPDADVVIVLPPSGQGELALTRAGVNERIVVHSVAELFDLLDAVCPAEHPRRRPLA